MLLKSPYPYFGGKSRVAELVWSKFGDVKNYVEPFFGSGAVLLSRPHWPFDGVRTRIETVNDYDAMIPNLWRAIARDPGGVARHADWPVSEIDLHARHAWLVSVGKGIVEQCRADPDFYDVKVAGWWVWGICQWIGTGWCAGSLSKTLPHLGDAGRGIHRSDSNVFNYIQRLRERLRRVRICCGDWSRVCGNSPTTKLGDTAMFLDPPYSQSGRCKTYSEDHDVTPKVRNWCLERTDRKDLKIALCGYAGEGHEVLESAGWEVVQWKASGGYGSQGDGRGRENAKRECIWFSPSCSKL